MYRKWKGGSGTAPSPRHGGNVTFDLSLLLTDVYRCVIGGWRNIISDAASIYLEVGQSWETIKTSEIFLELYYNV